ncbi:MAG: carboxypeptidase-like regulatory domain-containing protein [Chthoniobacterales bacterium]
MKMIFRRPALATAAMVLVSASHVRADSAIGGVGIVISKKSGQPSSERIDTDAAGAFRFKKLPAGEYTLTLLKDSLRRQGARSEDVKVDVIAAKPLRGLHADRLLNGIPVVVGENGSIAGQVYEYKLSEAELKIRRLEKVRANVKVINGKRYVWVPKGLDTKIPGKWVEEGSDEVALSRTSTGDVEREFLMRLQEASARNSMGR